jgi:hypothetical protein
MLYVREVLFDRVGDSRITWVDLRGSIRGLTRE